MGGQPILLNVAVSRATAASRSSATGAASCPARRLKLLPLFGNPLPLHLVAKRSNLGEVGERCTVSSDRPYSIADGRQRNMNGSKKLLTTFTPDVVNGLVEFNKYVSELDSDFLVFMARKALRLHDLLVLCGGREPAQQIFSHHVLDLSREHFEGKRITLVDDTLILGTTLGGHERRLRNIGASVSSIVFASDRDNHVDALVKPIRQFREFDRQEMMTFCAAEVKALQKAGIPYLTDFPVTRRESISRDSFARLQCLVNWDMYCTSVDSTDGNFCRSYTFLPAAELLEKANATITRSLSPITEIVKVRAFVAKSEDGLWIRFVPIVTLRALTNDDISRMFTEMLRAALDPQDIEKVLFSITSTKCKLRFLQYVYSSLVGELFFSELKDIAKPHSVEAILDTDEAVRYFGDWLRTPLEAVHSGVCEKLTSERRTPVSVVEARLPEEVTSVASSDFDEMPSPEGNESRSIFTDLVLLFVEFYRRYEKPARAEARRLGAEIFTNPQNAPYRDRLRVGFTWQLICNRLLMEENLLGVRKKSTLSLLLDQLVDMGIAVPVLTERNGVHFRGYRHGEDVLFSEQEIALTYDMLKGYCESTGRDDFSDRIVLEKLIACLLRVGSAKGLLDVIHGRSGSEGIARIGFHIHGAVPFVPDSDSYIPENKESWISVYLRQRQVLKDDGGIIRLGTKPEGVERVRHASGQAELLGNLLGKVLSAKVESGRVMNVNEFMLAVTCPSAKDAVGALAAELRFAARWSTRFLLPLARPLAQSGLTPERAQGVYRDIVNGDGYAALHSARVKYLGFMAERIFRGVDRGLEYLQENDQTGIQIESKTWSDFWAPIRAEDTLDKRQDFSNHLHSLAGAIKVVAYAVFSIELSVASWVGDRANYRTVCSKVRGYIEAMDEFGETTGRDRKLADRLKTLTEHEDEIPDPKRAIEFAVGYLEQQLPRMRDLVSTSLYEVEKYGKSDQLRTFEYLLWYDIIDSTGQKSGCVDHELRDYRQRVREFTESVNSAFSDLIVSAPDDGTVVCSSNGPIHSDDDEKHLFFSGETSRHWLEQAIRILVKERQGIRCRIIAARADFAGVRAHNYEQDPMIRSKPMWEHLSRLKKKLKEIEDEEHYNVVGQQPSRSLLWICGELLSEVEEFDVVRERDKCARIMTEMDGLQISTDASLTVY